MNESAPVIFFSYIFYIFKSATKVMTLLSFCFLQQSHPGHKPALCTNTTLKVRLWNCGRNYHKPALCTNTTLKARPWNCDRNYHKPTLCTNTTLKVRLWNCCRNYTALPPLEAQWSQPGTFGDRQEQERFRSLSGSSFPFVCQLFSTSTLCARQ